MICIGSTGDVYPYVLLGKALQKRGHDVAICAFPDFEEYVRANGLRYFPLSGDARDFMSKIMKPGAKGVGYLGEIKNSLLSIIGPFIADMETACDNADAVVATYFGNIIQDIAAQRHLPFVQTHYYPMDSNTLTPISAAPGLRAGKGWYKASYRIAYFIISAMEKLYLTDWRKEQGMPPRKFETLPHGTINGHRVPVLYAMSPLLMPRPRNWDEHIHMTGFWRAEGAGSDYQPPKELADFLAAGEKPVYIGFGSMVSGDMGETLSIVLEAIRLSGVRAVLAKGWGNATLPQQENVYVASGYLPHDWLFARCCAVVHHGGAGTTAAGLCAGMPTLVIPFGGDQPFWGLRVRMMGLGPKPIPRDKLTAPKLAKALKNLINVKSYRVAARELGERLRTENGVQVAANIIEHEVDKWLEQDDK